VERYGLKGGEIWFERWRDMVKVERYGKELSNPL